MQTFCTWPLPIGQPRETSRRCQTTALCMERKHPAPHRETFSTATCFCVDDGLARVAKKQNIKYNTSLLDDVWGENHAEECITHL